MSLKLEYDLNDDSIRPIVALPDMGDLLALLDTGANISIWTGTAEDLKMLNAIRIREKYEFGGFGGNSYGELYCLNFRFGDLIFEHMPIIVCTGFSKKFVMILAASLFEGLIYTIDNVSHKFIIDVPDGQDLHRKVKFIDEDNSVKVLTDFSIELERQEVESKRVFQKS